LNLQLNENDKYIITSDTLFANNITDQKSFQNYAIKLFKNLIK